MLIYFYFLIMMIQNMQYFRVRPFLKATKWLNSNMVMVENVLIQLGHAECLECLEDVLLSVCFVFLTWY